MDKKLTWYKNYLEIKTDVEEGNNLNSRLRAWFNYQRNKKFKLTKKQESLLDELSVLIGRDWRVESYKEKELFVKREHKRKIIKGFGERLKEIRIKRGYPLTCNLTKETKIASSTLRDWENEVSIPSCDRLVTLCLKLSVSSDYLLFGKTKLLNK